VSIALITGASRGLGLALARELARRKWQLVVDARGAEDLEHAAAQLDPGRVTTLSGDVADPQHRHQLADAIARMGALDLLVNNASILGPTPLRPLDGYPIPELEHVFDVNTFAPLALVQAVLPQLRAASGAVVNITSDAAVEAYEEWGAYGASKAALDHLSAILAVEQPSLRVYAFDPGDMRTAMQQEAFPGEDISDRPVPETIVPALLRLVDEAPPSGRYRARDMIVATS